MLKPTREYYSKTDVSWYFDAAAEAGAIAVESTNGGPDLDNVANVAEVAASASNKTVVGLVLQDVVDIDTTRVNKSSARDEAFLNEKVAVATSGWFYTDQLKTGETPANGDIAVLTDNGEVMVQPASWDPDDNPKVGYFGGTKSTAGFVKLIVDIEPVSGQLSS